MELGVIDACRGRAFPFQRDLALKHAAFIRHCGQSRACFVCIGRLDRKMEPYDDSSRPRTVSTVEILTNILYVLVPMSV